MRSQAEAACAEAGSFLEAFLQETRSMTPEQRGSYLENPPSDGPSIDSAHEVCHVPG